MRDAQPGAIHLKDYRPPDFLIPRTELHIELYEDRAEVHSRLHLCRREGSDSTAPLELHGQDLELLAIALDGRGLEPGEYRLGPDSLRIEGLPASCVLQTRCRIRPQDNSSLEGLYKSRSMFCTQCEAEGFRKITWYLDRPDVLSTFTVTLEADASRYPVLLSNGNLEEGVAVGPDRHRARWHDPFPKPAYLFAVVAGDLQRVEDRFRTRSGREVVLHMYVEAKDLDKCGHAMDSLKRAMRWDEEVYGREYDLDIFNIVAVDDFNMGAMENKSLNIFNTSCVLSSPDITTDAGFQRVEAIVAHEYFHNWSGNRVTCRDWFQLSLKEGFTVFRDAEFSADTGSRTVKRIEDVSLLRSAQFAEDAGPMAHPVRPDSYIEISNFYTVTVYEKGAEVVRMIHTLLGPERFRAGCDLYFERHDGEAATCEDFVCAMEEAGGVDLRQFRRWYSQAGTPRLTVRGRYQEEQRRYLLEVDQSCPPTPGQPVKEPLVIPLAMGLLGDAGNLPLKLAGEVPDAETGDNTHRVLLVDAPSQRFVFEDVAEPPVPSLLRGFSAPVELDYPYGRDELRALMTRDDDGFVRWDASQQLALQVLHEVQQQLARGEQPAVDPLYLEACDGLLRDSGLDPAMVAEMLQLPGENYLAELAARDGGADVDAIHAAREALTRRLGAALREPLLLVRERLVPASPYAPDAEQIAARSLRNRALHYLAAGADGAPLARRQFEEADNLTDRLAALRALAWYGDEASREEALARCYADWRHEALVVNQWFQLQAQMPAGDSLQRVQELMRHPDFDLRNPNKVRAVVAAWATGNPVGFHRADGAGYRLLAEVVGELNGTNPQMAARLLTPLTRWRNYRGREQLMRGELQRLAARDDLSADVYEVVSKSLGAD